jgi:imidazolonepropionase-like amidohydrolase
MDVRRLVAAAAAVAVVLAGWLVVRRRHAGDACFPVAGRHAVWLRGVRVFDGEAALPSPTDVLVVDQTIAAVGPLACVDAGDASLDEVPGAGRTLLPGLVDAHAHVHDDVALRESLRFGVTTAIDMGGSRDFLRSARGNVDPALADVYGAGMYVTAPGGHGTEYGGEVPTLERAADAPAFVDARIREGSQIIKLILDKGMHTLDLTAARAVVDAAHARGVKVVAHVGFRDDADEAVSAGVDGLAHVFPDQVATEELVDAIARQHVFVVPTLQMMQMRCGIATGRPLLRDPRIGPKLTPPAQASLGARGWKGAVPCWPAVLDTMKMLHGRTAILAGTDCGNDGTTYGAGLHRELELLVEAGLSPAEALRAATAEPARAFGLEDRGRIAVGKRADLLLVEGDPTVEVTATRAIVEVYKQGVAAPRPR